MSELHRFWVERFVKHRDIEGWTPVSFVSSNSVQYCHGYLDAMDALYPSPPYRICKRVSGAKMKVIRETKGRAAPHVN